MRYFICLLTFFLVSCSSGRPEVKLEKPAPRDMYEAFINSWSGQNEKALLDRFGKPNSTEYLSDNKKIVTYFTSRREKIMGTPSITTGGHVFSSTHSGTSATYKHHYCTTIFTIENGVIIEQKWDGNDCRLP